MTQSPAAATTRRAAVARASGPPDVLGIATVPLPDLGAGQVRVATRFAGVNFWDVMQRRGDVPLGPDAIPGVEGVGTVVAVGSDVPPSLIGTRVAWSRIAGSYADLVQGAADAVVPVPDGVPDEVAAAVLMQGITAQYLAESTTDLRAGQSALVTAAAGGVGSLLTQFLRTRGVEVIGVVGSEAKVATAAALGARVLVDSPALAEEVRAIAPDGVDAVFDAGGGEVDRLIALLARRGICALYGSASGAIAPIDPGVLAAGSRYLTRTAGRDYAVTPQEWRARADDVLARVAAGTLVPAAIEILPLDAAAEAHRRLESRATVGKVLLDPASDTID